MDSDNSQKSNLNKDLQYLLGTLAVAKTHLNGYYDKTAITGAILVQFDRIVAIGYDNPQKGEIAELMALAQVNNYAPGATLYTSMAPSRFSFNEQMPLIIQSEISGLVYGYCEPVEEIMLGEQNILQLLEEAGIRVVYIRTPEILSFYSPYRFADFR